MPIHVFSVAFCLFLHLRTVTTQSLEIKKTIKEELVPGSLIANLSTERDFIDIVNSALNTGSYSAGSSPGSNVRYNLLTSGRHSQYFAVDPSSGVVTIKRTIDREFVCSFREECLLTFQIAAQSDYGSFFQLIAFNVLVVDINDNPPEFTTTTFDITIPENANVGRSFQLPIAFDRDTLTINRVMEYRLLQGPSLFGVNVVQAGVNTSDIFLTLDEPITRESATVYKVLVGAIDGGIPPLTGTLTVQVHIADVNDNFPIFEQSSYVTAIPEIARSNKPIIQVKAADADSGLNGEVVYSFSAQQPQDDLSFFRVDPSTGEIFLTQSVEARAGSDIDLLVEASDRGHPPKISRALVTIKIQDTINSMPEVIVDTLGGLDEGVAEVSEYAEIGKVVAYISVRDPDSGENGQTGCQLSGSEFQLVQLDYDGKYKAELKAPLDREKQEMYNIKLSCSDNGFPPLTATADFVVKVLDENDQTPVFSSINYEASVYENNTAGAFVIQLTVTDGDIGSNAEISFEVVGASKTYFDIDKSGKVTAKMSLDREVSDKIEAKVIASDGGNPRLSSSAMITVSLLDMNDMKPEFPQQVYIFEVEEEQPAGQLVGMVTASDKDLGVNKDISYHLQESRLLNDQIFVIGEDDGVIRTNAVFDRERTDFYSFVVLAVDKGKPPLTGTASVIIKIFDTNDNDPFFIFPTPANDTIAIPHSVEPRTQIVLVQALDIDADLNARIIYSISSMNVSAPFIIDPHSGALFTKDRISRYQTGLYILTVMAHDQAPKQQRGTQMPLYVEVYFDNSTMFTAMTTAGLAKEVITAVVVVGIVMLVTSVIVVTVLCIRWRKSKKKLAGKVPNSASTSSTAKLQGGYYIAPGVRGSASSSVAGKQEEGTYSPVVILSQPSVGAPAEIIEIAINGHQNGFGDAVDLGCLDDDRFSTFRSQEDILSQGHRYGSLRRQDPDNSSVAKRPLDDSDDLSCNSASDSGRGGSDVDVNNGAAAVKQDKVKAKGFTPISIKNGISKRLSPLPQQEKAMTTFRGESPKSSKFDSDSDTLERNSQTPRFISVPVMCSDARNELPNFGSGSGSAFSGPPIPHGNNTDSVHHDTSRQLSRSSQIPGTSNSNLTSPAVESESVHHPHMLSRHMSVPHSTYPRNEGHTAHSNQGLNPSHSLTRRNHIPVQETHSGPETTHPAYGVMQGSSSGPYLDQSSKRENLIPEYNHSQAGFSSFPHMYHRAASADLNPWSRVEFNPLSRVHRANNRHRENIHQLNLSSNNTITNCASENDDDDISHQVSMEEDFLLPPYPEMDGEEEDNNLRIHPGYTVYTPEREAERSALFSESRFESNV